MSLQVGRKGYVGLAIEVTPGVPVAQQTNLYEVHETLEGMVKPLQQTASYAQRDKVWNGVLGERWGQGDVEWELDPIVTPYLLGAALGTISDTTVSGVVVQHTLTQNQNSTPLTLSIYRFRSVDQQLFTSAAVDQLEISFAVDKFAAGKATIKSLFPSDTVSGSITRNTQTVFTWGGANLQFGTSIVNALEAAPTPITDFRYTIKNNTKNIFESGTLNSTRVAHKDFELDGDYTLYFESTGDRNNYYNNVSQATVMTFFGNKLGLGQYTEEVQLQLPQVYLETFSVETGLDNFFIEKAKFVAEANGTEGFTAKAVVVNNSATP